MAFELIAIGTSQGGLYALKTILSSFPEDFPISVIVVQHRHKASDDSLGMVLQRITALPVIEVEDKSPILPGYIHLAPPDYHLLVEKGYFSLSTEEPVLYSRPSIDVLFESAACVYREKLTGIILTGASKDGAFGIEVIKKMGGYTIAQDPVSAENSTMPEAAIKTGAIDRVLPLEEIGPFIVGMSGNI